MNPSADSAPAKKASKPMKAKVLASHPPVLDMVKAAIVATKDRKGSSLSTIKKHIAANYKVDVEKLGPHIRRGITHAVEKGVLSRVGNKGKGASGSFKLADKADKPKAAKTSAPKKAKTPQKPKAEKKVKPAKAALAKTKKSKTPKKVEKPKTVKKVKTPMKVKTPKAKVPAKKLVVAAKAKAVKKPVKKADKQ